jgi:ElaB/YqjD/DUF883 family membrane-anchored ribosome-binding protein
LTSQQPEVRYSAFVARGRLCILGVADTTCGPVPLASYADISGDSEDGPVGEDAPENVKAALDTAIAPMQKQLARATMQAGAESLVLRARARDQNAMAILALIGEQAREGNERARVAAKLVEDYCRAHPDTVVTIGEDGDDASHPVLARIATNRTPLYAYPLALATYLSHAPPDMRTVVCLANGPSLTKDRILEIASRLASDEESHTFLSGIENAHDTEKSFKIRDEVGDPNLFRAGRMLGQARAIQKYRINGKIVGFCADSAWEMGE